MIEKSIEEIASMLQCDAVGDKKRYIKGVQIDSRCVEKDSLYVPMIGQRVDGHSFISNVVEKGAGATLWQKDHLPYPEGISYILVDDTTKALQSLAKAYMETLNCKVIAVTGSNGKTSCKDMLHSVFSQQKRCQKTQGNHNNEIGLPLTILEFNEDIEVAILEMGMENRHEIDFLCSIVKPDITVITTIGSAHMENLGGKYQIAQAKCEIFENMNDNGYMLYNKESPEIDEVLKTLPFGTKQAIPYGKNTDISITSDIEVIDGVMQFSCSLTKNKIKLNAIGHHMAMNALPCIAIALKEGLSEESVIKGLETMNMTKMRSQLIRVKACQILDDSYKSNPESAKAAIDTLMTVPASMHIAVLSDMLDLGPKENELHEQIGQYAKEKKVDLLVCTGPLSKYTIKAANGFWYETKEECVEHIKKYVDQDCVILVKGSRAMAMDKIVSALKEV